MRRRSKDQSFIPLARPRIGKPEMDAVRRVLKSRHLAQGAEVEALEREVSALLGGRPVVAVSSGGAALLLAMAAAGVGPETEVIVPCFTFPAAAQAAMWLGAKPVPADVCYGTLTVDPVSVKKCLSRRTRAVVVPHAFGIPADNELERIIELVRPRGIFVIEDAACGLGGRTEKGRPLGTFGDFACFSLHPRKPVAAGEGGLIACDEAFVETLRVMRDYGRTQRGFGNVFEAYGLNFRLSDVAAAIARAQLSRLEESKKKRRALYMEYQSNLRGLFLIPDGFSTEGQTYQSLVVDIMLEKAAKVAKRLLKKGIETGPAGYALTEQPFYLRKYESKKYKCPVSEGLARSMLALPIFDEMTKRQVRKVCKALAWAVDKEV